MKKILLIEDNVHTQVLLQRILETHGNYSVHAVSEGKLGMKLLQEKNFHLVITDLIMEGQEGMETLFSIREHKYPTKVIAISSNQDYLAMTEPLVAASLKKPIRAQFLLDKVKEVIESEIQKV